MWMLAETLRQKPYVQESLLKERQTSPPFIRVKLTRPLNKTGVKRAANQLGIKVEVEELTRGAFDLVARIKTNEGRDALVIRVMDVHLKGQGIMPSKRKQRRLAKQLFPGTDIAKITFSPPYPRLQIHTRYHLDSLDSNPHPYWVEKEHVDKAIKLIETMIEESAKPLSKRATEWAKRMGRKLPQPKRT